MNRLVLLLVSMCVALAVFSQRYPATYHAVEALRGKQVSMVVQGFNGFVWLAGADGLYRYDGWQLDHITAVPSGSITHLQAGKEGVWLGMGNSRLYHYAAGQCTAVADSFCSARITGVEQFGEQLFIATYGEGLWVKDAMGIRSLIPSIAIYEMVGAPSTSIWLATDKGVYQLDTNGTVMQLWGAAAGLPDRIVQQLVATDTGIWAATYDRGVVFLPQDKSRREAALAGEAWSYGQVIDMVLQPDGSLWLATTNGGLLEWQPDQPSAFPVKTAIDQKEANLQALMVDDEGATWALVARMGLLHIRADVGLYQKEDFLPKGEVMAIHAGRQQRIWVSTMEGLYSYHFPSRSWEKISLQGMQPADLIIAIAEDESGNLWLGTFGNGLLYTDWEHQQVQRLTTADGLVNDNILDIVIDHDSIWLATLGGASKAVVTEDWPTGTFSFTHYNQQTGLGANYIYSILIDQRGDTWFATDGEGLTRLSADTFTTYTSADGLSNEVIYTMTTDPQGNLWFSTLHGGLYRLGDDTLLHISAAEGLHGIDIVSLACDPHGHLVIVHEEGVDVLNTNTMDIVHLEDDIGLLEINANLNVITSQSNGEIWFGLKDGMVRFKPGNQAQAYQPITRLENMDVYLEPHNWRYDSMLSYRENHVSFGFVGLWFANPRQVTYEYQLEGYDIGWVRTQDRQAIYPSLAPGSYTFKVRSSLDGHFDNNHIATYQFHIRRPFWQTIWFGLIVFGIALGAIYLFVKGRERRLQVMERIERERIEFQFQTLRSQVNPHFLFNSFNTLLNVISIDKDRAVTYVEKLSDFFRSILAYREVAVISLAEELQIVRDYYFLQQQRYGKNFSLHIDIDEPARFAVPPLILQLLVENALKHNIVSRQKPLRVDFYLEENYLIVANVLQLKTEREAGTRVGLTNIKKRYQMLTDIPVSVTTTATHFIVRLPLIPYNP